MSSIGIGILKSVIEQNLPFSILTESGIDDTFLEGNEKDAYNFIKTFKYKHDKYPEIRTVEAEVPTISFKSLPIEPVEYWVTQLKERKQFWIISKATNDLSELLKHNKIKDASDKIKDVNDNLLRINQEFSVEDVCDVQAEVLDRHDVVQRTAGIAGIPYGYPLLDELTYGQQGGDFNVVIGQTGSCKSYFCLGTGRAAHAAGYNVMVISPEMPKEQIARRLLAMDMNLPDKDIRKGKLSYFAVKKARRMIKEPVSIEGEDIDNWFKIMPSGLYSDVNDVISVCNEYKPDLLIVDGFYLLNNRKMRSSSGWQEDESVIFLLKNFSIHANLPILASTQYNRTKPGKLEGARGSQSTEQVASNFFSLEFESPEDRDSQRPIQTRNLKIKKSRDGDTAILKYEFNFLKTTIKELGSISGINIEPEIEDPDYIVDL